MTNVNLKEQHFNKVPIYKHCFEKKTSILLNDVLIIYNISNLQPLTLYTVQTPSTISMCRYSVCFDLGSCTYCMFFGLKIEFCLCARGRRFVASSITIKTAFNGYAGIILVQSMLPEDIVF